MGAELRLRCIVLFLASLLATGGAESSNILVFVCEEISPCKRLAAAVTMFSSKRVLDSSGPRLNDSLESESRVWHLVSAWSLSRQHKLAKRAVDERAK